MTATREEAERERARIAAQIAELARKHEAKHEADGNGETGVDWERLDRENAERKRERKARRKAADECATAIELVSAKASSIKMIGIKWLWQDRFAIGKIGIIAGLPDEGKGLTLAFITAQVTTGGEWPMKEGHSPPGNVIIFSDEDDPNDTLVPRLAAAGANLDRVHIIKLVRDDKNGTRMFSLVSDIEVLRRKIIEIGNVVLVLIDPISAYFGVGKVDSFRGTDVRAVLTPLQLMAAKTKVAIIGVLHFNKKTDVVNALLRISDSLAFGAIARHVYGVIDDDENDRKLFVRAKNNAAAKIKNKTLAYRFGARDVGKDEETGEVISAPFILWEDAYVDVTAVEAMQAAADTRSPATLDGAVKFLADILAKGPVLKSEIMEAAEANGISERTLFRAKAQLKVEAEKETNKPYGKWSWRFPREATPRHWNEGERS
jgi:putative DNA primase/helicase